MSRRRRTSQARRRYADRPSFLRCRKVPATRSTPTGTSPASTCCLDRPSTGCGRAGRRRRRDFRRRRPFRMRCEASALFCAGACSTSTYAHPTRSARRAAQAWRATVRTCAWLSIPSRRRSSGLQPNRFSEHPSRRARRPSIPSPAAGRCSARRPSPTRGRAPCTCRRSGRRTRCSRRTRPLRRTTASGS